jgi:hypothetical protein
MPRKMFADALKPTAPPTRIVFSKIQAKTHHPGEDAPVEEEGREGAHHQDDGQGLEGEHEAGAGCLLVEGQRAAAEVAEDEGGAGPGRFLDK